MEPTLKTLQGRNSPERTHDLGRRFELGTKPGPRQRKGTQRIFLMYYGVPFVAEFSTRRTSHCMEDYGVVRAFSNSMRLATRHMTTVRVVLPLRLILDILPMP